MNEGWKEGRKERREEEITATITTAAATVTNSVETNLFIYLFIMNYELINYLLYFYLCIFVETDSFSFTYKGPVFYLNWSLFLCLQEFATGPHRFLITGCPKDQVEFVC